jgi:putative adenylate-forming enzyme
MPYRFKKIAFKLWQAKRAREIVNYAFLHSPFYHNLYRDYDIEKWKELPITDKKMMMENFDNFNTQGISKDEALVSTIGLEKKQAFKLKHKNISVSISSGTSGYQSLFILNSFEESRWVGTFLAKAIPYEFRQNHKVALFMRPNAALYEALQVKKIQFKYFDLIRPVADQIIQLEKYRPTLLVAPPSLLRSMAFLKREMRLRLRPKKIFSIAEVLEPIDQDYIECIFEQKLHQIYQAAEGFFGITCSHNTLHLNEELMVFQEEDLGHGRFIPIVTDLFREVQPLIRYRLEDVLMRGENNCGCGSYYRTIEKVECRKDDVFVFYDVQKNHRVPMYPEYIREAILTSSEQIQEYRVIQDYANHLKLQLRVHEETELSFLELRIQKSFNELFRRFNIAPIQVEISYDIKKDLPLTKVKRVERLFQPEL